MLLEQRFHDRTRLGTDDYAAREARDRRIDPQNAATSRRYLDLALISGTHDVGDPLDRAEPSGRMAYGPGGRPRARRELPARERRVAAPGRSDRRASVDRPRRIRP